MRQVGYLQRKTVEEGNKQKEGAEGTDFGKGEGIILKNILLGSVCVCVRACVHRQLKKCGVENNGLELCYGRSNSFIGCIAKE